MGYHELLLPAPRPTLRIETSLSENEFTLDLFGSDDGSDRGAEWLRFVFQLGSGFMIYLYVLGVRPPGSAEFFHDFTVKDCAVITVDEENLGAPGRVESAPLELPAPYARLVLEGPPGWTGRAFAVQGVRFAASHEGTQRLSLRFELQDELDRAPAELRWDAADGWTLSQAVTRPLDGSDRLRFERPASREPAGAAGGPPERRSGP